MLTVVDSDWEIGLKTPNILPVIADVDMLLVTARDRLNNLFVNASVDRDCDNSRGNAVILTALVVVDMLLVNVLNISIILDAESVKATLIVVNLINSPVLDTISVNDINNSTGLSNVLANGTYIPCTKSDSERV